MSKLLDKYNNLKNNNSDILYLFKNGAFYIALQDDAYLLSNLFNLKITKLNDIANKCGFPCSSFDKYYIKLNNLGQKFKIIENNAIYTSENYLNNQKVQILINEIKTLDISAMSVSEAFKFLETLKSQVENISNGN